MVIIGYTEFRQNLKRYLQLSQSEKVVIKNNGVAYEVSPSRDVRVNPSPSGDKWFDDANNMEEFQRVMKNSDSGKSKVNKLSKEEVDNLFAL